MSKYVFDTSALLTYIENEAGADTVEELILKAGNGQEEVFISVISLVELFYITAQEQNIEIARERIGLIKILPLDIQNIDIADVETVGLLKANYKISFADSCIAGLARIKNATLVHKDPEYDTVPIKQIKLPAQK